ncbi:hypothetical protein AgCh_025881 [Apium graveolens]
MRYGSIGWSVGATLRYAQAAKDKRIIACIGDGNFQGGYTIEVEFHDGPYNMIKNWHYTALVDAIHNGEGQCWKTKVCCEKILLKQ